MPLSSIPDALTASFTSALFLAMGPLPLFPFVAMACGLSNAWEYYGLYYPDGYLGLTLLVTLLILLVVPFRIGPEETATLQDIVRDVPVPDAPQPLDRQQLSRRLHRWLFTCNESLVQAYWDYLIKARQVEEGRASHWPRLHAPSFKDYLTHYQWGSALDLNDPLALLEDHEVDGHYRQGHYRHTANGIQYVRGHHVSPHTRRR